MSTPTTPTPEEKLAAVRKRRAEARAEVERKALAQRATDAEAIADLEDEHGVTNVAVLEVPYTEGLPLLVALRTPSKDELSRYRHALKGPKADATAAAELLGSLVLVYPDPEVFKALLAARPGIRVQIGTAAVQLATGVQESEKKE